MKFYLPILVLVSVIAFSSNVTAQLSVIETAREIPVAYEADVVVVGGTDRCGCIGDFGG